VAGGIVIAVILVVVFPVLVALGGLVLAAVLGTVLDKDAKDRFEGSELLDLAG
jgi:hypothetical protein